jgi:AraC-like DNA-binding protein
MPRALRRNRPVACPHGRCRTSASCHRRGGRGDRRVVRRVERLAGELGWSRNRLWSRFRTQVGLTPKRAAQLVRFDHAAHRRAAGHSPAVVAADAGYADQSHLNRDAMAFAGLTTSAVATAPWLAVDEVAWPDAIPHHA